MLASASRLLSGAALRLLALSGKWKLLSLFGEVKAQPVLEFTHGEHRSAAPRPEDDNGCTTDGRHSVRASCAVVLAAAACLLPRVPRVCSKGVLCV